MGGIATLTLNAAEDRTLAVEAWRPGGKSRVLREWVQAGGKGINVARVLRSLGVETLALAVVGGESGRLIERDLERAGIEAHCIQAPGRSRTCLEIVDAEGRAAQLHGPGVDADEGVLAEVLRATRSLPDRLDWLAVCGSLPPGMPEDAVGRLVRAGRDRGLRVAVDVRGPALARAWSAGPDVVRVNDAELAEVLPEGSDASPPYPLLGEVAWGVVSRGPEPYQAWSGDGVRLRVTPPPVEVVNAIGCGDAMLAGLLAALAEGSDFPRALRRATALASAEAASPIAGSPDLELARSLESRVGIEALAETRSGADPSDRRRF